MTPWPSALASVRGVYWGQTNKPRVCVCPRALIWVCACVINLGGLGSRPNSWSIMPRSLSLSLCLCFSPSLCHFVSFSQSKSLFFPSQMSLFLHPSVVLDSRSLYFPASLLRRSTIDPSPSPSHHLLPALLAESLHPLIPRPLSATSVITTEEHAFTHHATGLGVWRLLTVANGEFGESAALVRGASVDNIL